MDGRRSKVNEKQSSHKVYKRNARWHTATHQSRVRVLLILLEQHAKWAMDKQAKIWLLLLVSSPPCCFYSLLSLNIDNASLHVFRSKHKVSPWHEQHPPRSGKTNRYSSSLSWVWNLFCFSCSFCIVCILLPSTGRMRKSVTDLRCICNSRVYVTLELVLICSSPIVCRKKKVVQNEKSTGMRRPIISSNGFGTLVPCNFAPLLYLWILSSSFVQVVK